MPAGAEPDHVFAAQNLSPGDGTGLAALALD
jgi:hypothetical protein